MVTQLHHEDWGLRLLQSLHRSGEPPPARLSSGRSRVLSPHPVPPSPAWFPGDPMVPSCPTSTAAACATASVDLALVAWGRHTGGLEPSQAGLGAGP